MSVKVPSPMVSYQSHNHCQCDFCCSRRAVNAKKWAVSQYARQLRHAKQLRGQPCDTVSAADAADFARTHGMTSTFDPNHPEPVDQMARNAQRGRAAGAAGQSLSPSQQRDADEAATLRDLDKLERLLMLEHKARVQAALEADKLATLRQTGRAPALQPLPPGSTDGYTPTSDKDDNNNDNSNGVSEHNSEGDNVDQDDIHDAFVRAHHCPVPPPAQCAASARLQDTLNDLRLVTMDPANAQNRSTLQRVLDVQAREDALARGEADAAAATASGALGSNLPCAGYAYATRAIRRAKEEQRRAAEAQQQAARARAANGYGETLADIRTSAIHPQGAGVVWRNTAAQAPLTASQTAATAATSKSNNNNNNTQRQTTPLPPGAAAALAMQQSNAAVSTRSRHA